MRFPPTAERNPIDFSKQLHAAIASHFCTCNILPRSLQQAVSKLLAGLYIYIYSANVTLSWRTTHEFQRVFVVCRFVPENDIKTRAASLGSNDHVMLVYKTNTCIIIHSETRVHERLSK